MATYTELLYKQHHQISLSKTSPSLCLLVCVFAMTPYYHFIPTKIEELFNAVVPGIEIAFPFQETRYRLVENSGREPTLLNLYDHWTIKKVVTCLDDGSVGVLVLDEEEVSNHVLKYWTEDRVNGLMRDGEQIPIVIRDLDTKTEYDSYLMKSSVDGCEFVLDADLWTRDFVHRRNLVEGDSIGLYWHDRSATFCFAVLKRNGNTSD